MTQENGKNMKGLLIALAVLVVLAAVGFFVLKPKTTPATPDGMAQVEGAVDGAAVDPSATTPEAGMTEATAETTDETAAEAGASDVTPPMAPPVDPAGLPVTDPAAPAAPMVPTEVPADTTPVTPVTPVTPTTNVPAGVPTTPEVLNAPTPVPPADTTSITPPEMPAIAAPKAADQCGLGNVIGSKAEGMDLKGMTVLKPGEVAAADAKNVVEIDASGTIMRVICP